MVFLMNAFNHNYQPTDEYDHMKHEEAQRIMLKHLTILTDSRIMGNGVSDVVEFDTIKYLEEDMNYMVVYGWLKSFTLETLQSIERVNFYATHRLTRFEAFLNHGVGLPVYDGETPKKAGFCLSKSKTRPTLMLYEYNSGFIDRY